MYNFNSLIMCEIIRLDWLIYLKKKNEKKLDDGCVGNLTIIYHVFELPLCLSYYLHNQ